MSVEEAERHLISAEEASRWLGVPVTTLYGWAWTGKIPHYKVHKRVLFGRADLLHWLEKHHRFPNRACVSRAQDAEAAPGAPFVGNGAPLPPAGESSPGTKSSFWGAC